MTPGHAVLNLCLIRPFYHSNPRVTLRIVQARRQERAEGLMFSDPLRPCYTRAMNARSSNARAIEARSLDARFSDRRLSFLSLFLRRRTIAGLVAALAFSCAGAVAAWSQSSTASLRGTVMDPQTAVVAGAEVGLTDSATAFSRTQKTDDHGAYQFLQVPPGTYTVSVATTGFTTSRKENVVLLVNTPATLN